jgi:hypothetical protein
LQDLEHSKPDPDPVAAPNLQNNNKKFVHNQRILALLSNMMIKSPNAIGLDLKPLGFPPVLTFQVS